MIRCAKYVVWKYLFHKNVNPDVNQKYLELHPMAAFSTSIRARGNMLTGKAKKTSRYTQADEHRLVRPCPITARQLEHTPHRIALPSFTLSPFTAFSDCAPSTSRESTRDLKTSSSNVIRTFGWLTPKSSLRTKQILQSDC